MKILKKFIAMLEAQGRYRTFTVLRGMSDTQLRDMGVSPELLSAGVKGWPWQAGNDDKLAFIAQNRVKLSPVVVRDVVSESTASVVAQEQHKSAA